MTKNIHIYDRDINKAVSEFTRCILQAAKEAIPKGARKEYKPYGNNDLDKLHNELNTARDVAESEPTSENNTALKQVNAKFIRARNDARRKSWISKTADLNMEKDGKKLWRLTKQLNDEGSRYSKITLIQDDTLIYGKTAANLFADTYQQASNIQVTTQRNPITTKNHKRT